MIAAMPITAALTALLEELAEDVPDVLSTSFTFATLWQDLCRIAGEPVPRDVAAVLDAPLDLVPPAVPLSPMGEYTPAYADQFAEAYAD